MPSPAAGSSVYSSERAEFKGPVRSLALALNVTGSCRVDESPCVKNRNAIDSPHAMRPPRAERAHSWRFSTSQSGPKAAAPETGVLRFLTVPRRPSNIIWPLVGV
jgi:hypothetical protein